MVEENSNIIEGILENNTVELDANLDFRGSQGPQGIKGEKGDTGYSICSVVKKSGTGASGTIDIYAILINDEQKTEIGTFKVYNGVDGSGGTGAGIWGQITGNIVSQTDLIKLLNEKASTESIPTKVSQLENDSDYASTESIPTKVSQLENDSDYASTESIPTKVSQLENDSDYALNININTILKSLGLETNTYSSSSTYNVGDLVVYNHTIYECNTANTTGTWDSSKWTLVPIITN